MTIFCTDFLKLQPSGIKFALFYTRDKLFVHKSANFMPSGTILKTVQKSPIYIFVNKWYFLTWGSFYPLKIALQKSFFTPYFPNNFESTSDRANLRPYLESAASNFLRNMSKPRKFAKKKSAKKCVNKSRL